MKLQDIINNAGGVMEKSAAAEYGELEQALAHVAAQGYYDTLNKVAGEGITQAENTAFREEPKDFQAIVGNAMQILSENDMKPGELGMTGTKQTVPASGASGAGGGEEAPAGGAGMDEKVAAYANLIGHLTDLSTGGSQRSNEKIACFICSGSGCGVDGMTGVMKFAEAQEVDKLAEDAATFIASHAISQWVDESLSGVKIAADSADHQIVMEQMAQAQAMTDSKFDQLYVNNPRVGGVDQGGMTEEFNPLLNDLLKPNRTAGFTGQE